MFGLFYFFEVMIQLYKDSDYQREVIENSEENHKVAYRSDFRHDYARLIHSPAFRRLQGKTQLFPGHESDFFRNRLTHSLEVAQIAKTIANKLNTEHEYFKENNIDTDLVEFAGLAHDLGHPPFGHNGEKALDDCMKSHGGFEGNAQTLHILAKLEKKRTKSGSNELIDKEGIDQRLGLHLTYRSLASILKYDKKIPLRRNKASELVKGYYCSDADLVGRIRNAVSPGIGKSDFKCVECYIMDIADDIAYSTYDLEDGLKGGFISPLSILSDVITNPELYDRVLTKVKKSVQITTEEIYSELNYLFGDLLHPKIEEESSEEVLRAYLASSFLNDNGYIRTSYTSGLVNEFVEGIEIDFNDKAPCLTSVKLNDEIRRTVEVLKHLNFEIVIMSSRLKVVEYRGYEIVKTIFEAIDSDDGHLLLPPDYRLAYMRLKNTDEQKRLICDFVAGMTDKYAIEFYSRIKGGGQTIFKPF
ncbi:deoxyguanosinetriphosphate triphosphohydrolase family protein [Methylomonas sp. TEB]|uniref:deoxyguanosinetriphosphate triphosphohydrolase family protein n=1 Tax=Methylomonas sp. TEB TaxID=3398229 RepID=UPI0039F456E8